MLAVRNPSLVYRTYFSDVAGLLWEGAVLNLVDVSVLPDGTLVPGMVVVEPDFLVDISTLADCVREYGDSPANYYHRKLVPVGNLSPLLLGNIVNLFLDEWIHSPSQPDYALCMKKAFGRYAIELSTCRELEYTQDELDFFRNCRMHFDNIRTVVQNMFTDTVYGLSSDDALLEPSYICETLGLQGRLDYMQRDMSAFIEMKSGKADEFTVRNSIRPLLSNKVQMMLYLAVLHYNMGRSMDSIRPYLLYTRYPRLYPSVPEQDVIMRAMRARNRIVAGEYAVQHAMSIDFTASVLDTVSPEGMNEHGVKGPLWTRYQKPKIESFRHDMAGLDGVQRKYYLSLYNFITREMFVSKVGTLSAGRENAASLWLSTLEEKQDNGSIICDMRVVENCISSEHKPYAVFAYEDKSASGINFREGDQVLVYERNSSEDSVLNKLIFKGNIETLTADRVKVRFRSNQRNGMVLPSSSLYALEPDRNDKTFMTMYAGLYYYSVANSRRRRLLTGEIEPEFDSYWDYKWRGAMSDFDRIAYKALAARDYFLLVGPPGTGKTSRALKRMVEMSLERGFSGILLLSYTNRAVDEICKCLSTIEGAGDYIRLGSELACDEAYRSHLIENRIAGCANRRQVRETLRSCRIFVSTVLTLQSRMELFAIKRFDCAFVDEATQILEPHLLGILSARTRDGRDAIDRFVLIGDHKQLPAVVAQDDDSALVADGELRSLGFRSFKDSLFERLYRRHASSSRCVDMLCRQGRMHPVVADFSSRYFYGGRLLPLGLPHQREQFAWTDDCGGGFFDRLAGRRLAFVASSADSTSSGKVNAEEARIVADMAVAVYRRYCDSFSPLKTLGVIAPYRSQIACIRNELQSRGIPALCEITVDTVERYQGSERDVIIYSFCLNREYQVEQLSNFMEEGGVLVDRKLNVALTRTRKQMFMTGVPGLLCKNVVFRLLIDYLEQKGCFYRNYKTACRDN